MLSYIISRLYFFDAIAWGVLATLQFAIGGIGKGAIDALLAIGFYAFYYYSND